VNLQNVKILPILVQVTNERLMRSEHTDRKLKLNLTY
jgi:hypothetical protein